MKTDIFHLQIIPIDDIHPHEEYDESRALPLVESLKKEQMLENPILVAAISNNKFLQLDGMNRFSAFKMLGIKSILAQIVDYNDQESVELSSWVHLLSASKNDFFDYLNHLGGYFIKEGTIELVGHRYIREEGLGRLCTLCVSDGTVYLVSTNGNFLEKLSKLNKLVAFYENNILRDVMPSHPNRGDIDMLFMEHRNTNLTVVFPTFTRHQIVDAVKKGKLFPSGVTRHIIKLRCLNVRVPLSIFNAERNIDDQNRQLEKILSFRKFRLYEEPTIYFE